MISSLAFYSKNKWQLQLVVLTTNPLLSTLDFYGMKFRDVEEMIWATVKTLGQLARPADGAVSFFPFFKYPCYFFIIPCAHTWSFNSAFPF